MLPHPTRVAREGMKMERDSIIACPYCQEEDFRELGKGKYLGEYCPRHTCFEIADEDAICRCCVCGGFFGITRLRIVALVEGNAPRSPFSRAH
jgi:hypothetical protein